MNRSARHSAVLLNRDAPIVYLDDSKNANSMNTACDQYLFKNPNLINQVALDLGDRDLVYLAEFDIYNNVLIGQHQKLIDNLEQYRLTAWGQILLNCVGAQRNIQWMKRVLELPLTEKKAVMVVGAAHLEGPGGLLSLFAAHGWFVEKIELPRKFEASR